MPSAHAHNQDPCSEGTTKHFRYCIQYTIHVAKIEQPKTLHNCLKDASIFQVITMQYTVHNGMSSLLFLFPGGKEGLRGGWGGEFLNSNLKFYSPCTTLQHLIYSTQHHRNYRYNHEHILSILTTQYRTTTIEVTTQCSRTSQSYKRLQGNQQYVQIKTFLISSSCKTIQSYL